METASNFGITLDDAIIATSIGNNIGIVDGNISKIAVKDTISDLIERLNMLETKEKILLQIKCKSCGGSLSQNIEEFNTHGIIKCPYCDSVYIVSSQRLNDK